MVTHKKVREILRHWDMENAEIRDIYYENTGERNEHAYYVGDAYILKFFAEADKLQKHIRLSREMENIGLSSAVPVRTGDGQDFVKADARYFCLTKRLNGSQIKTEDFFTGDHRAKARFVGEILGQLHLALKAVDVKVDTDNLYEDVISWALPKARQILDLPEALCRDYTETFGALYEQLPVQIIHRDPNPGNIIGGGKHWGFIDFDLSEKNIRIFDPCYAATAVLSESFEAGNKEKLACWLEIYQNILYGYDSAAKLTEAERRAVPYVVLSTQLICVAWFAEQEKYPHIFEINKAMTRWLIDHFEQLWLKT